MADTYNGNAAKFQVQITQGEMHAIIPKTGADHQKLSKRGQSAFQYF